MHKEPLDVVEIDETPGEGIAPGSPLGDLVKWSGLIRKIIALMQASGGEFVVRAFGHEWLLTIKKRK